MFALFQRPKRWVCRALTTSGLLLGLGALAGCGGGSGNSSTDTTPPTAPTNLTAMSTSSSEVDLTWTASTDNVGVAGYRVERCQGSGCSNFTQISTTIGTLYDDTGLSPSTSYSYRVRATDAAGNLSGYSNNSSATTQPAQATAPTVSSVSPNTGTTAGGTPVTITGTNFAAGATVTLGGAAATNVVVVSATQITATTPAHAAGAVTVTVTANSQSGNLTNGFTYLAPPTVSSVSPNTGTTAGGTPVTITGTNFVTGATVTFGSTAATNVVVVNATQITATTPAHAAGAVTVTVTVNGRNGSLTNGFTYNATAAVSFVQVNSATPQTAQTSVTLAYLQAQTAGNLNVVAVGWSDATATITTVSDSKGNTYTLAVGPTVQAGTATQAIYYAKNISTAGANANAVTVTFSAGANSPDVRIAEYAGVDSTNPVDVVAAGQGNGTPSNSGSVTTGNPNDLLVGANLVQQVTTGPGSGYTSRVITSPDGDILEDEIVSTTGSYNATAVITGGAWIMQLVAFRAAGSGGGNSVTVTVGPKRAALTTSQKQQFTATVTDPQNGGVSWSVDGINGGSSTVGTVSNTGLYAPGSQVGVHTVTATSNSNPSVSASASVAVTNLTGVFTYHNDNARTGQNLQEYGLTTSTVNPSTFGALFTCPVDGYVYAQPLYIANFAIGGQTRNVVFVVTEHDSVYAFDADSASCVQLWHVSFLSTGVTPVPPADTGELNDLIPEIGITSTPVIDSSTSTIYVVAKTKETVGTGCSSGNPCYVHRLHALSMTTGAEKFGGPVVLSAPNFVPLYHLQRPALLLNNGTVYIGFGSHGDNNTWQGWLMAYSASTLGQQWVWHSTDPTNGNNFNGALWGSGNGPALDASGNIYVETANGLFDGTSNFSDSVVKLSPAGTQLDYFTPFDQAVMQSNDIDLGSSGPIILPDTVGSAAHPHVMVASGKVGIVYFLDQTNLGHYNSGANQDLGEVSVGFNTTDITGGFFGQPAYWNGNIYTIIVGDSLRQFTIGNGSISTVASSNSSNTFQFRGATPTVSASGTTNGIVWVADVNGYQSGGAVILDAYDGTNVSNPLFSSPSKAPTSGPGAIAPATKFTVPTVANGKVYVGGQLAFTVFGLLPN